MSAFHLASLRTSMKLCLAVGLSACSAPEEMLEIPADTGFPHAIYHSDCAPWDGPALTLLLTHESVEDVFQPPYPHLRITTYEYPAAGAGAILQWEGDNQNSGFATLCSAESECRTATSVWARLAEVDVKDELMGELRVEFSGEEVVGGPFRADRIEFQALCG